MNKILLAAAVLAIGATSVLAESDPIATRKATMKSVGGAFYGVMGKMNKGETPFDQAQVAAALKKVADAAKGLPALYPDTAKTGGDTAALPKVWETKSDFDARYGKLAQDAEAAIGKITDEASLKANYSELNKNCNGCHEFYRAKKS